MRRHDTQDSDTQHNDILQNIKYRIAETDRDKISPEDDKTKSKLLPNTF